MAQDGTTSRPARRRWVVVTISGAITGAGVVMLLVARSFEDAWAQGVLLNVGAACLLVAPLWWVGRQLELAEERIEHSVEVVRTELAETQQQVATLLETTARVTEAAVEREEQRATAVSAVGTAPSQETVREVLDFATKERSISAKGFRVAMHPGWYPRVSFRRGPDREVEAVVEHRNGEPYGDPVRWAPGQEAAVFVLAISDVLTAASIHPGIDAFDGGRHLFEALSVDLTTARTVKARFQGVEDAGDVIEVCGDQWSVCDWGVLGWTPEAWQPYYIVHDERSVQWWRENMREKSWVDMEQLTQALETAHELREYEKDVSTPNGI